MKRKRPPSERTAGNGPHPRVLIIDDDQDGVDVLGKLFELSAYPVEVVTEGSRSLERLCAFGPDVVLLDIAMPGITGYEVARQIRAQAGFESVLIIAISGYADKGHEAQATDAGIDQYLMKPVEFASLQEIISQQLKKPSAPVSPNC